MQRYEPLPGARSLIRRGSEDEDLSSISSSNSSHHTNTAIDHTNPRLGSSLEGPSFLSSASPSIIPPSPPPSTAFSFLSRNNTVGRRIPMTDITRTTSSFVSRIVTNNQLAKILVARTSDDTNLFYNCGSNFVWVDAFGRPKVNHTPLTTMIPPSLLTDKWIHPFVGTIIESRICQSVPNVTWCQPFNERIGPFGCYYWIHFWRCCLVRSIVQQIWQDQQRGMSSLRRNVCFVSYTRL